MCKGAARPPTLLARRTHFFVTRTKSGVRFICGWGGAIGACARTIPAPLRTTADDKVTTTFRKRALGMRLSIAALPPRANRA
jgi:hypothetical protein